MTASEYLRRRMEATPKIIAPRPLGDSSMVTQKLKFAACAGRPYGTRSDGSGVVPSTESVLLARAGCSVCANPPQETAEIACCPIPEPAIGPLDLQTLTKCCVGSFVTAKLADPPQCCSEPGYSRTLLANDMPSNFVGSLPPCKPVNRCVNVEPEPGCWDPSLQGGRDPMFWDSVLIENQSTQPNPCGTCDLA
jgi:hypothetical protein